MKLTKIYIQGLLLSLLLAMTMSCEDFALGEKLLQKPPSSDITVDTVFSSAEYTRSFLYLTYGTLPYGIPTGYTSRTGMHINILEGLTDLNESCVGYGGVEALYYSGLYNAGSEDAAAGKDYGATKYRLTVRPGWVGVRYSWIIIENIDRVPDMTEAEKNRLKAEAKIIIAVHYVEMLRHFGALPIVDHAFDPNEANLPARATLQENIDFIVRLLDEAAACKDLPWMISAAESDNWSGRLTRAAALGLKARLLLFAASPLFNSDAPYYPGEASDKLMTWLGGYKEERWRDAANACEEFFNAMRSESGCGLVQNSDSYRLAFRDAYYTRGTTEMLISCRLYSLTTSSSYLLQSIRWGAWCPTKEYFDMFPMVDGTDFDWDNPEHSKNPFVNRDPRLCETILLDGDVFGSGVADICKEKADDKTNYPKGANYGQTSVLDSHSMDTGLPVRKFALDRQGEFKGRLMQWPILRVAEIYLSYAEALNEINHGPNATAYEYVNAVRRRVGVGDLQTGMNQQQFREAVLRERACEFGFEEVRFFDLIRWKREADFTKHLHGINIYRHKDTKEYLFEFPQLTERAWQKSGGFSSKWYLSAFPPSEVNKGYGLVQNPGWE